MYRLSAESIFANSRLLRGYSTDALPYRILRKGGERAVLCHHSPTHPLLQGGLATGVTTGCSSLVAPARRHSVNTWTRVNRVATETHHVHGWS
eukprot:7277484-Pyramimonas_sp.AAC.1